MINSNVQRFQIIVNFLEELEKLSKFLSFNETNNFDKVECKVVDVSKRWVDKLEDLWFMTIYIKYRRPVQAVEVDNEWNICQEENCIDFLETDFETFFVNRE